MTRSLAMLGLAALLLSACALERAARPPPAPLAGASLGLSATTTPALGQEWWQAFGDPQLDALIERAQRSNPSLSDALARIARARAEATAANGLRWPQVSAAGSELRERVSGRYIIPPPYAGTSLWNGELTATLDWNLDFWGRQREVIRAAQASARAREFDARAARLAVEAALVATYLELDRAHALAEVAAEAEQTAARMILLTRERLEAGLDTTLDMRTAAAFLPEARVSREQAEVAADLAVHQLAALSGQGAAAYAGITPPHLTRRDALVLPDALPADLLLRRPDVQAALARVEGSAANEEVARLARYPQIDLQAFAGFAALTLRDLVSAPARTYGAGAAAGLPIFDAGVLRAREDAAHADLRSAIAGYDASVLAALREVADHLTRLDSLSHEIREQERRFDLLNDAYALAGERYQGGITGQIAVLEARSRLLNARRAVIDARALEAETRVALVAALGGPAVPSPASASSAGGLP